MPDLLLVRHGQGGATPEKYDELSPLGHRQARQLGQWLLSHQREFCALAVGRLRRQRETLDAVCAVYAQAGRPLPPVEVLPGLDEYRFIDMLRAFAELHPDHPELVAVRERPGERQQWVGLLRTTLSAWSRDQLPGAPESFAAFRRRTSAALDTLQQRMQSGSVLAVSSAGVMGRISQQVLGFDDATFIDVNLSFQNTAMCEYRLTRAGLKLASLNALPHLAAPEQRELVTMV